MINFEKKKINKIFLGGKSISKVFKGNKLVYQMLPNEYQEVEYIESTGTQYIDTGIYPYKTTEKLVFSYTDLTVGSVKRFTALYDSGESPTVRYYGVEITTDGNFKVFTYDAVNQYKLATPDTNKHTLLFNDNNNKVFFDGVEKAQNSKFDLPRQATLTLPIFRTTTRSETTNLTSRIAGRLYNLKLWDKSNNNELIRDFIPCYRKSDGEIGLYDIVNNVFYTNDGTGVFLKGGDV